MGNEMSALSPTESHKFTQKAKEALEQAIKSKKTSTIFWMKWASPEMGKASEDPLASFINFAQKDDGTNPSPASKSITEIYRDLKDWAYNEHNVGIEMEGMSGGSNVPIYYATPEYLDRCRSDKNGKANITVLTKYIVENIKNKKEKINLGDVDLKSMTGILWHGMEIVAFQNAIEQLNDTTTKLRKKNGQFILQF